MQYLDYNLAAALKKVKLYTKAMKTFYNYNTENLCVINFMQSYFSATSEQICLKFKLARPGDNTPIFCANALIISFASHI